MASSFEPRPLLLANVGSEDLAGCDHGELLQRTPLRSESRNGLNRTSTVSPGLTASRRQPPARTRFPGLVISITQTAAPSSARSLTMPLTERLTCGLTQRSSTTSPLIVMVLE